MVKLDNWNSVGRIIVACPSLSVRNRPWKGRGQGHVTNLNILHALKYLPNGWSQSRQILCDCRLYQALAFEQLTASEKAWLSSGDQVYNFTPHEIYSERLKLQTSNFVRGLATRSTNIQMTNCSLSGRGQDHVPHSRISHPMNYLWNGKFFVVVGYIKC